MEYWMSYAAINVSIVLSMCFIQKHKIDFFNFRNIVHYLAGVVLFVLSFEICPVSLRVIVNGLIYIFTAHLFFGRSAKESFILGVLIFIINMLAEIIYAVISINLVNHELFIISNSLKVLIDNIFIGLLLIVVSCLLGKFKLYERLVGTFNKIRSKQIVIFSLLLVVIFNFFMWLSYFTFKSLYESIPLLFVGSVISIFSSILVFSYLKTNNKYADIYEKYNLSLKNIRDYENIIENNRISNHEIRNQFLMLRNMSKNKKMTNYIDSILNNSLNDSEELLNEVIRIPSGGLRGLIYTKLLSMKENNINYELYVDKKINVRKINKIDSDFMVNICKIVGVFLDNAIEAVQNLDEKNITVELYSDKKDIVISITNNFAGFIDIETLEQSGYTTKANGHGYGLKLVRDILDKNDKLVNYRELYEDNFTQNLKIKM